MGVAPMVLCHLPGAFVQVPSEAIAQRAHDRKQAHGRAVHELCLPHGADVLLQALLGDRLLPHPTSQRAPCPWPGESSSGARLREPCRPEAAPRVMGSGMPWPAPSTTSRPLVSLPSLKTSCEGCGHPPFLPSRPGSAGEAGGQLGSPAPEFRSQTPTPNLLPRALCSYPGCTWVASGPIVCSGASWARERRPDPG